MHKFLLLTLSLFLSICSKNNRQEQIKSVREQHVNKPITVFVHGTLFSAYRWLVHLIDVPTGFYPVNSCTKRLVVSRIPGILNQADPEQFPIDTFYLFGWSGALNFDARKQAARDLYQALKKHTGSITIIAQSHGCNVALNLAQAAQEAGDTEFKLDRLILLAGPVQAVNSDYCKSHIFKKIYVIYSSSDFIQVLDPQYLYRETRKLNTKTCFFSGRTLPNAPHIIQTQLVINRKSPSHMDFILSKTLRHIPKIIKLLDKQFETDKNKLDKHYRITVRRKNKKEQCVYSIAAV